MCNCVHTHVYNDTCYCCFSLLLISPFQLTNSLERLFNNIVRYSIFVKGSSYSCSLASGNKQIALRDILLLPEVKALAFRGGIAFRSLNVANMVFFNGVLIVYPYYVP